MSSSIRGDIFDLYATVAALIEEKQKKTQKTTMSSASFYRLAGEHCYLLLIDAAFGRLTRTSSLLKMKFRYGSFCCRLFGEG